MPQVNVYIPEDLAEMLPRYREALNLSQICAQALRQAIQKLEAANQPPGRVNTQRLLDRLRDQQQRQSAAYKDGAEDAARWLEEEAQLEEIRYVACGPRWRGAPPQTWPPGWSTDRFVQSSQRYRGRREELEARGLNQAEYEPAYQRGWLETVGGAWNEIKDQL